MKNQKHNLQETIDNSVAASTSPRNDTTVAAGFSLRNSYPNAPQPKGCAYQFENHIGEKYGFSA